MSDVKASVGDAPETWILELKPTGPGPDMAVRVRHMLKFALRTCGIRCVVVRNPTPAERQAIADAEMVDSTF